MRAEHRGRVRALVRRPRLLVGAVVLLLAVGGAAVVGSVTATPAAPRVLAVAARATLLRYQGPSDNERGGDDGGGGVRFSIAGNATRVLYPGTTSPIDLSFTNKSGTPIDLGSGAVGIRVTSPNPRCSASVNFKVDRSLLAAVTIPRHAEDVSLGSLRVPPGAWPVIEMLTTHVTQDACADLTLTLHYSTGGSGGDDGG